MPSLLAASVQNFKAPSTNVSVRITSEKAKQCIISDCTDLFYHSMSTIASKSHGVVS